MKNISILITCCFLIAAGTLQAQKTLALSVTDLLAQIPMPADCGSSYANCIKQAESNGSVTVTDVGGAIATLNKQMDQVMKDLMNNMQARPAMPATPSAEQIAKMQQQAQSMTQEQMMQAAKNNASRPTADNPAVLKKIMQAQMACAEINRLISEFISKAHEILGASKE